MKDGIIFVAGIYGVGKSTLCERLSISIGIPCYSAGDLISAINGEIYGRNKTVVNKEKNQDILVTAVNERLQKDKTFILAGHFCIFDPLSIKPEYANKIFDGQKHYEYRKRIPKKEVSKIVVYSSAPEQAVIGEVEVVKTLKMKPTPLWNSTKANAGISRLKYREYFSGCTTAYAFALGSFKRYETSKSLADFNIQSAPQSFVYLDD